MIGLLPCAGTAERFNGLPKYLLPCPNGYLLKCHIEAMKQAVGLDIYIGANSENYDIVARHSLGALVYRPFTCETMTQTVMGCLKSRDNAILDNDSVLFGLADTYFDFPSVYERLATRLNGSNADVVLAVFKARPEQHREGGMVSISHNKVVDIVDKPEATHLQYIWGAMAWRARFWSCLTPDMPHVGYGVKVAIEQGFDVQAVSCAGGFWDCGTFERYVEMLKANT